MGIFGKWDLTNVTSGSAAAEPQRIKPGSSLSPDIRVEDIEVRKFDDTLTEAEIFDIVRRNPGDEIVFKNAQGVFVAYSRELAGQVKEGDKVSASYSTHPVKIEGTVLFVSRRSGDQTFEKRAWKPSDLLDFWKSEIERKSTEIDVGARIKGSKNYRKY